MAFIGHWTIENSSKSVGIEITQLKRIANAASCFNAANDLLSLPLNRCIITESNRRKFWHIYIKKCNKCTRNTPLRPCGVIEESTYRASQNDKLIYKKRPRRMRILFKKSMKKIFFVNKSFKNILKRCLRRKKSTLNPPIYWGHICLIEVVDGRLHPNLPFLLYQYISELHFDYHTWYNLKGSRNIEIKINLAAIPILNFEYSGHCIDSHDNVSAYFMKSLC